MINVYFPLNGNKCVGAISIKEYNNFLKANVWELYKIFPITEKTILFKRNEKEFCVINGKLRHEMGLITTEIVDKWLHVTIKEM